MTELSVVNRKEESDTNKKSISTSNGDEDRVPYIYPVFLDD